MTNTVSGRALHSGVVSTVTVSRRAEDDRGLLFYWPGFDAPLEAADWVALRRSARRATILENGAGGSVRTPEHLLAAALFFADAPLDIYVDAAEPPGLDGSALPFYQLLRQATFATEESNLEDMALPTGHASEYESKLDGEYTGPEGSMRVRPDTHFSVEYLWEDGEVLQRFELKNTDDAPKHVLGARTFILYRDWVKLSAQTDLLAGAGADSGVLLATTQREYAQARENLPESRGAAFPLLHPEFFRFENEPARHKVLDLMGDLALNGLALPKLRLTIRNGGHALNHLLLNQLQQERLQ